MNDARQETDPGAAAGVCRTCAFVRIVQTPRSVFVRCRLSDRDPRYPRYPRLPMVRCAGHRPA